MNELRNKRLAFLVATSPPLQTVLKHWGESSCQNSSRFSVGALHTTGPLSPWEPSVVTTALVCTFKWCEKPVGSFQESPLQNFHWVPISHRLWPKNIVPFSWKALPTIISRLIPTNLPILTSNVASSSLPQTVQSPPSVWRCRVHSCFKASDLLLLGCSFSRRQTLASPNLGLSSNGVCVVTPS